MNQKTESKTITLKQVFTAAAVAVPVVAGTAVYAATAGANSSDFDTIVTLFTEWLEGSLGKVIALGSLAVGLAVGIAQQSIMAVTVGIAMALAVSFGPGVLNGMFTSGLII